MVVSVDPTTRWVELGAVPNLTSHDTAMWFHAEVVCRYGLPLVVRTDKGSEYRGEFDFYMKSNGVDHRLTATMNPRANGLVERVNRVIKEALRRFAEECPGGKWWEVLGDVARSLRVLPTRALGFAPYVLVFKAPVPLAIANDVVQTIEPASLETAEEDMGRTIAYWDEFFTALR